GLGLGVTDPLRRHQPGNAARDVKGIALVKIGESIGPYGGACAKPKERHPAGSDRHSHGKQTPASSRLPSSIEGWIRGRAIIIRGRERGIFMGAASLRAVNGYFHKQPTKLPRRDERRLRRSLAAPIDLTDWLPVTSAALCQRWR